MAASLTPSGFAGARPAAAADAPGVPAPGIIADHYIVVLRGENDPRAVSSRAGAAPVHVYTQQFRGFSAPLDAAQVRALEADPTVERVVPDRLGVLHDFQFGTTQTMNANGDPWGLDRIDETSLPLSGAYFHVFTGSNVHVYIVDSGIQTNHAEFGDRAVLSYDAAPGGFQFPGDCNGHGTHVAGTVGGTTFGVAKQVQLRSVRVADCDGNVPLSALLGGVSWMLQYGNHPGVVNMSFGFTNLDSFSKALIQLNVNALVADDFVVVVSAGNESTDACQVSPASAPLAFTVAASTRTDRKADFSNFGPCVDAYAPGQGILSAKLGGGSTFKNGTSMAAPHVSGAAALLLHANPSWSPAQVTDWITTHATKNAIQNNPANTQNRLLYKSIY